MKKNLFRIAALAFVGAFIASCSSDDELSNEKVVPQPEKDNIVTLTGTIGTGMTRSVINEATGAATWSEGDQIRVRYKDTSGSYVNAVGTIKTYNATTSTFTATLTNPDFESDDVVLVYPSSCYTASSPFYDISKLSSQDGTLAGIGNNYNIQIKEGLSIEGSGNTATINGGNAVTLEPKVCITKITLKDGQNVNDFNTANLTISQSNPSFSCTVNASTKKNEFYVALPEITGSNDYPLVISATGPLKFVNTVTSTDEITSSKNFETTDIGKFIVVNPTDGNKAYLATPVEGNSAGSTYSKQYKEAKLKAGNFYNLTVKIGQNFTPVAVIAYVGAITGKASSGNAYCDKFLALALEDATSGNNVLAPKSEAAKEAVQTFTSKHPITISGTTYNSIIGGWFDQITASIYDSDAAEGKKYTWYDSDARTSTTDKTGWRIPSVTDWRYIMQGLNGGITPSATSPIGVLDHDGVYPTTGKAEYVDANTIKDAINNKCGNENLRSQFYWTSTETVVGNENKAWRFSFVHGYWMWNSTDDKALIRAVFAY